MANKYQEQDVLYFENSSLNQDQKNEQRQNEAIIPPQDLSGQVNSSLLLCANCKKEGYSEIRCEPNKWTCLYSCIMAPICICFIPFFINNCQDVYHRCPNCNVQIGFTEHSPC